MIRALLFDFDGLILDTETCDYEAWRAVFRSYGCELPLTLWVSDFHAIHGTLDPYVELETQLGRPIARRTVRHQYQLREAECNAAQPLLPGVADYLVEASRLGLKTAVVSSESRAWIVGHLSRFNLERRFDHICCADDTQTLKPAPNLYQLALTRLGVAAHEALALEDSPNGIRAAKQAGVWCVAVPNPVTRLLNLSQADLSIDSLAHQPLIQLIEKVKGTAHAA